MNSANHVQNMLCVACAACVSFSNYAACALLTDVTPNGHGPKISKKGPNGREVRETYCTVCDGRYHPPFLMFAGADEYTQP